VTITQLLTTLFVVIGAVFFLAGTVGVLRFPDTRSRLHAITKADNLGLGFIVLGLAIQADSLVAVFKLLTIWIVALLVSSIACYLLAQNAEQAPIEQSS
jgi:multicomponent Na+:H+ antiporter subunit G